MRENRPATCVEYRVVVPWLYAEALERFACVEGSEPGAEGQIRAALEKLCREAAGGTGRKPKIRVKEQARRLMQYERTRDNAVRGEQM